MTRWFVSQEESGRALIAFLKSKLPEEYSNKAIKRAVENNKCQVNGRTERFGTFQVGFGDSVALEIELLEKHQAPLTFEESRLLYEDPYLLIYDKPAHINSESNDLLNLLKKALPSLTLIHRLDKETTGALIFSKTEATSKEMLDLFKKRQIRKEYLAIVDRFPKQSSGTIENELGIKHRYEGQTIWGSVEKRRGLPAITHWSCEQKFARASLLKCSPVTGRTHQIRVHLSEMGHPILGDHQYGRQFHCNYNPQRILLHASCISFEHPITKKQLHIQAALPNDFQEAFAKLKGN